MVVLNEPRALLVSPLIVAIFDFDARNMRNSILSSFDDLFRSRLLPYSFIPLLKQKSPNGLCFVQNETNPSIPPAGVSNFSFHPGRVRILILRRFYDLDISFRFSPLVQTAKLSDTRNPTRDCVSCVSYSIHSTVLLCALYIKGSLANTTRHCRRMQSSVLASILQTEPKSSFASRKFAEPKSPCTIG